MARDYRMKERARALDETRERIVRVTMALHDEQGVAATSLTDVAKRAGVGAATVYRHFPTLGTLVMACGAHVWAEMRPPVPEAAPVVFEGVSGREARLLRLVEEVDALYRRGELRLAKANADRDRIPELEAFLQAVESGVSALAREALSSERLAEPAIEAAVALTDFGVWQRLQRLDLEPPAYRDLMLRLLKAALGPG